MTVKKQLDAIGKTCVANQEYLIANPDMPVLQIVDLFKKQLDLQNAAVWLQNIEDTVNPPMIVAPGNPGMSVVN